MAKTACIIIIGNEVLSGKTQDTNSHYLSKELRTLGVDLRRVVVIPDEIELIGREVAAFACGFGVKVVRHPDLERRLRERHGANINEARLRMAEVPEGAELIGDWSIYGPVPKMRNVYIFAGIPKVLQDRFSAIRELFREAPYYLKVI